MEANQLIQLIERVFSEIPKPETSLRQFKLTDLYGLAGEITDEAWEEAGKNRVDEVWQEITDSEIEECEGLLAHMQAEEFQYYLPAYMRYAIKISPLQYPKMTLSDPLFFLYIRRRITPECTSIKKISSAFLFQVRKRP